MDTVLKVDSIKITIKKKLIAKQEEKENGKIDK